MKSYIISIIMLITAVRAAACNADSTVLHDIGNPEENCVVMTDSILRLKESATNPQADSDNMLTAAGRTPKEDGTLHTTADTSQFTRYDRRVYRYRRLWNFLIPTQFVTQYAGNMGMISAGIGWDYGCHRQYETNLLFGYLPRFQSESGKMTMTLKQNFVPWRLPLGEKFNIEPLSFGIYFNTVFGTDFWGKQPKRYPSKYYPALSTKVRINIFMGQRFTAVVPRNRRKFIKSLTAFYEVSTCDLYLRAIVQDSSIKVWDIVGLSIGLKAQML